MVRTSSCASEAGNKKKSKHWIYYRIMFVCAKKFYNLQNQVNKWTSFDKRDVTIHNVHPTLKIATLSGSCRPTYSLVFIDVCRIMSNNKNGILPIQEQSHLLTSSSIAPEALWDKFRYKSHYNLEPFWVCNKIPKGKPKMYVLTIRAVCVRIQHKHTMFQN